MMARKNGQSSRREMLRVIGLSPLIVGGLAWGDEPEKSVAEQIVDAMNTLFGKHPGFRSAHAKGVVCEGMFEPGATAAGLTRAPHLNGKPVKATIRFSDSTGVPNIPDGVPDASPHGMAVKFHMAGATTDIVSNAFNGFAVATPEDFLGLLRAVAQTGPKTSKPTPIEVFLGTHPKALKVITAPKPTPESFATEPYFGVNAFVFTNKDGKAQHGRYQFRPEAGAKFLTPAEAAKKPANFLIDELRDRLASGPIKFRLVVQLAAKGDPVNDATEVWPDDRPVVELGVLAITSLVKDNDAAQRALAFDPMRLVDGIEGSDDPLLELRSTAYAISRRRRK